MKAFVYMLRCRDGSYYVGSSRGDLAHRVAEHEAGLHLGYTSRRLPVALVWSQDFDRITDAIAAERQIKGWRREKKEALIAGRLDLLPALSRRAPGPRPSRRGQGPAPQDEDVGQCGVEAGDAGRPSRRGQGPAPQDEGMGDCGGAAGPRAPVALIVAVARNGVIGAGGRLPWHIPADLAWFKAKTLGKPLVMGRKTWDSLPRKPLPGRAHVILTRGPSPRPSPTRGGGGEAVLVAHDLDSALALATAAMPEAPEIMVIGGADIFALALPRARRIYLTEIHAAVAGDVVMPPIPPAFAETFREDHPSSVDGESGYSFVIRERHPGRTP